MGFLGYSDDNFILAPSRESLQVMLTICEDYAKSHGLKFSTDPDPSKSKTRCLTFLQKERPIKPVLLCGNELPWVSSCKHLGNTIVNTALAESSDIRSKDINIKRAAFINRNNELLQEFNFAHPKTKMQITQIYNSHFYGSVLWDLSSKLVRKVETSWNVAVRRIFNLRRETHCYFVEPVSEMPHIANVLARNCVNFVNMIRSSKKVAVRSLLKSIEQDTRSVTGQNLRRILLNSNQCNVQDLKLSDVNLQYRPVPEAQQYRVGIVKELIEVQNNQLEVPGFTLDELDELLQYLCVS